MQLQQLYLRQCNPFNGWNELLFFLKFIFHVIVNAKVFRAWYLQREKRMLRNIWHVFLYNASLNPKVDAALGERNMKRARNEDVYIVQRWDVEWYDYIFVNESIQTRKIGFLGTRKCNLKLFTLEKTFSKFVTYICAVFKCASVQLALHIHVCRGDDIYYPSIGCCDMISSCNFLN